MSLPDFCKEENSSKKRQKISYWHHPKLAKLVTESKLNAKKVLRPPSLRGTKKQEDQKKSLFSEDEDENDDYSVLLQVFTRECCSLRNPKPDDIVYVAATYWLKNKKIQRNESERSSFLCAMNSVADGFGKDKFPYWKSKKEFDVYFEPWNGIVARRNSLVKKGILRCDADRFIRWLCNVFIGDDFGEVPDRVLGPVPNFNAELDTELLLFVCQQNGLRMTRDFIDWNAPKCEKLSQFHPEFLAKRFENEYEYKRSKYYEMLKNKGDLLKQQDSINVTRDKVSYIINLFDMPIDDILDEIRNQLKTTEPRDQMLWVRVSPKFAWDVNPVLLRHVIRRYIYSGNKFKLADLEVLCYEDDEFTKDVCFRPGDFSKKIEKVAKSLIKKQVVLEEDKTIERFVITSLTKVVPYLSGKTKGVKNWNCVDLLLFGIMKSQEQDKEVGFRDYDDFMERYGLKKISTPKFLSVNEIVDMMMKGEPNYKSNPEQDLAEIRQLGPLPKLAEPTGYSRSFCIRKFSKSEWTTIVRTIMRLNFNRDDLKKVENWDVLIKASKVQHQRQLKEIQKEFFTEVEPHVGDYVDDEEIKDAFVDTWSSFQ